MILFPDDFYHFETEEIVGENRTNDMSKYIIDSWIQTCLEKLKRNPDTQRTSIRCGNTAVIVLRYGTEIDIMVTKDYYNSTIFTDSDKWRAI